MVCTFMLFVLPALLFRAMFSFWGWLTGKKAVKEEEPAKDAEKKPEAVKKGACPYHVVMRFLGLMPPAEEAKPEAKAADAAAPADKVKAA